MNPGEELAEDQLIGRKVAAFRRDMGWTQTDLAVVLRRRGVKWSPAIVSLVETGKRPVRLTEAKALAVVLLTNLDELAAWIPGEAVQ